MEFKELKEKIRKLGILNDEESNERKIKIGTMEDGIEIIKSMKEAEESGLYYKEDLGELDMLVEKEIKNKRKIIFYVRWFKNYEDVFVKEIDKLVKEYCKKNKIKLIIEAGDDMYNWNNKVNYWFSGGTIVKKMKKSII